MSSTVRCARRRQYYSDAGTRSVSMRRQDILLDADPIRLEQIFLNLLSNATKYTGRTAPSKFHRVETDGGHSRAYTGVGVPAISRVFEPCYQVERGEVLSRSRRQSLALPPTRADARRHHQAISEGEHQGSEFIVRLPITVHKNACRENKTFLKRDASDSASRAQSPRRRRQRGV